MKSDPVNDRPSGNMQPDLYAAIVVTLTLAVSAISLRFVSRRLVRAIVGLDDWLALTALALAIGLNVDMLFIAKAGVGMHIEDINRDLTLIYHDFFLTVWIAELLYSFALTATKLAILACYWRIFNVTSIKLPIKVLVTLVISWLIVRIVVTVCHCSPVRGYWDKSISANCTIDDRTFFMASVIPHLLIDLIILGLPVPHIKNLQISKREKFGVLGMFLFGGFICFATVIQLIVCIRLDVTSPDATWNFGPIAIWTTVESNLAVVAACLPFLRPVYRLIFKGSARSQFQNSEQSRRPYGYANGTWNDDLTLQRMNTLKNANSDSTSRFAAVEDEYNRSVPEAHIDASSTKSTYESEGIVVSQMHQAKDGIMVKSEVTVGVAVSDGETHTWRAV